MKNCTNCNNVVHYTGSFILHDCKHIYCFKCLREYISENLTCLINCPLKTCTNKISDHIIRQCLSNSEIVLYDKLTILAKSSNAMKCLTENCPYIVHLEKNEEKFQCELCKQPNCLICKKRHEGSCDSYNSDETEINNLAERALRMHIRRDLEECFKSTRDIPNPEYFECEICDQYILPREGLILRNCQHCFCKKCFQKSFENADIIQDFTCPMCDIEINEREAINVVGKSKWIDLILRSARYKYFQCKFPDCSGCWDHNNCKGCFTCPICKHVNCLDCNAVHEGKSCETFRKSTAYQDQLKYQKKSSHRIPLNCYNCQMPITVEEGRCGAIQCQCKYYVCQYTGKGAGNFGPRSCGCTPTKPCHENCKFGCFLENY